jgi:hypothetical protein
MPCRYTDHPCSVTSWANRWCESTRLTCEISSSVYRLAASNSVKLFWGWLRICTTFPTVPVIMPYLESQNATSENNTQYWLSLVGMLVGIRLLVTFLLRKKAGGNRLLNMARLRKKA